jgi:hypothetical protein
MSEYIEQDDNPNENYWTLFVFGLMIIVVFLMSIN